LIAPQILHLERPIQLYKSHELEFLVLRLKSAELGWKTVGGSPSRRRTITTTTNPKCMYLVEGGRWLLFATDNGSIAYFDLDTSTPTESILTPDQFDDRPTHVSMTIDRDSNSAFLTFNLVVSFCFTDTLLHPNGIQIWRVELVLDDQQQGNGLTAIRLASIPVEDSILLMSAMSICGPHLAFSVLSLEFEYLSFIINWKQADGEARYPRRLIRSPHGTELVCLALLIILLTISAYLFIFYFI